MLFLEDNQLQHCNVSISGSRILAHNGNRLCFSHLVKAIFNKATIISQFKTTDQNMACCFIAQQCVYLNTRHIVLSHHTFSQAERPPCFRSSALETHLPILSSATELWKSDSLQCLAQCLACECKRAQFRQFRIYCSQFLLPPAVNNVNAPVIYNNDYYGALVRVLSKHWD